MTIKKLAKKEHSRHLSHHLTVKGPQDCGFFPTGPFGAIVFPGEGDTALIASDEPAVADGDPMDAVESLLAAGAAKMNVWQLTVERYGV